jgi:hypothetical protein
MIDRPESLLTQIRDGKVDRTKIDNAHFYINHLESQVAYATHLHEKTKKELDRAKRKVEKYKKYIDLCLNLAGGELKGNHYKATFGRTNYRVEIKDMTRVPKDYLVVKTQMSVDKKKATELLKNGELIDGLDYIKSSQSIKWRQS